MYFLHIVILIETGLNISVEKEISVIYFESIWKKKSNFDLEGHKETWQNVPGETLTRHVREKKEQTLDIQAPVWSKDAQ